MSGLNGNPGKVVCRKRHREFESPSLRQNYLNSFAFCQSVSNVFFKEVMIDCLFTKIPSSRFLLREVNEKFCEPTKA